MQNKNKEAKNRMDKTVDTTQFRQLEGSEKQISWAIQLRKNWMTAAWSYRSRITNATDAQLRGKKVELMQLVEDLIQKAESETSAKIWIEKYDKEGFQQIMKVEAEKRGIL